MDRNLFGRIQPILFLRIGLGLVLLLQILFIRPEIENLYSNMGDIDPAINAYVLGDFPIRISDLQVWGQKLGLPSQTTLQVFFGVYVFSLVCLVLNIFPAWIIFLVCLLHGIINETSFFSTYGMDRFAQIYLFYLCLVPIKGVKLNWAETESPSERIYYAIFKIMQIHLALGYSCSGWDKSQGTQWWDGEVIWRALNLPGFATFDMSFLAFYPLLPKIFSIGTLILEFGYSLWIWLPYVRWVAVIGMIGMHAGIAVMMQLWLFSGIMIVLNLGLYVLPRLQARCRTHLSGSGVPEPTAISGS